MLMYFNSVILLFIQQDYSNFLVGADVFLLKYEKELNVLFGLSCSGQRESMDGAGS